MDSYPRTHILVCSSMNLKHEYFNKNEESEQYRMLNRDFEGHKGKFFFFFPFDERTQEG